MSIKKNMFGGMIRDDNGNFVILTDDNSKYLLSWRRLFKKMWEGLRFWGRPHDLEYKDKHYKPVFDYIQDINDYPYDKVFGFDPPLDDPARVAGSGFLIVDIANNLYLNKGPHSSEHYWSESPNSLFSIKDIGNIFTFNYVLLNSKIDHVVCFAAQTIYSLRSYKGKANLTNMYRLTDVYFDVDFGNGVPFMDYVEEYEEAVKETFET